MSNAIDKQVKEVKLYIYASKWKHDADFKINAESYLPQTDDYTRIIPLSEVSVEVPVPEFTNEQFLKAEVGTLEKSLLKEKADSHVRIVAIEEKIQSLLCIENQSDKVGG